ncbi:MAG: hypothetical protein R2716_14100 [Microthrixaceae bacterium]
MDAREDVLYLNPRLPDELHELCFRSSTGAKLVELEVTASHTGIHVPADGGNPSAVPLDVRGDLHLLEPGDTIRVP